MRPVCKCHGISASCTYRTCYRMVRPFGVVGAYLREKYYNAVRVTIHQSENQLVAVDGKKTEELLKDDLWFLVESPDYCVPNSITGSLGTTGRRCYKTAPGPGNCRILCCGRGYNTFQVPESYDCTCTFHWCCRVNCKTCERVVNKHVCRWIRHFRNEKETGPSELSQSLLGLLLGTGAKIGQSLVFTVTPSNCKLKIARFYEFLFTRGWR